MLYYTDALNGFDGFFSTPNKRNLRSKTYVMTKLKSDERSPTLLGKVDTL